jgi:RNA polymerase sigma-70 factor, ECF subfamily
MWIHEHAYQMHRKRNRAYFSLDRNDGIEKEIIFVSLSPHEIFEWKLTCQELYAAIFSLPDKQAKRIYAHFFLNMSKYAIAKAEGVAESAVRESIERGLRNIEKFLKHYP